MKKEIGWIIREKYNRQETRLINLLACYKGKAGKKITEDITRLKKGEPVDYIIGFVSFLNCRIDLSYAPFIPRAETEFWTKVAIKEIGGKKAECLDVFSGSGCIGIAVLKNTKKANIDFAEINKKFLKQIKLNLKINRTDPRRYRVFHSDIFQGVKKKYDYIFANPPYLAKRRLEKIQKSVIDFEPNSAFLGGRQGMDYIRKFLKTADCFLKKNGKIYLEFDSFQKGEIEKILKSKNLRYCFHKDQYDKWRFLTILK